MQALDPQLQGCPLPSPRVTLGTSSFPWRPMTAGHSWGHPEILAKAKALELALLPGPRPLMAHIKRLVRSRTPGEKRRPQTSGQSLEKPEKAPGTADSGRHVLEAAAPSPTLAVL